MPGLRVGRLTVFAVRAARLFDGITVSTLIRPMIFVDNGRITRIADSFDEDAADVNVIDLGDATLMPGLIDCHQHLVLDASGDPVGHLARRNDRQVLEGTRKAARTALAAGITTVRDLGDRNFVLLPLREELARDPSAGPELLVAGPPLTSPGGHCWFLGGETSGVDEVISAVRARATRRVDVIKVMITGGALTPGSRNDTIQFSVAELEAIVTEAHNLGLTVTGHVKCARGLALAMSAGFDGIEHGLFLAEVPDPQIVEALAAARIYISVTAAFKPLPDLTSPLDRFETAFMTLRAVGVRLILSSDAGINPSVPHDALPYGVMRLPRIGMANAEALRTVTSWAASACGLGDRKGRIAPGYDADIVATNGNPVDDLSALAQVTAVFRSGLRVV